MGEIGWFVRYKGLVDMGVYLVEGRRLKGGVG